MNRNLRFRIDLGQHSHALGLGVGRDWDGPGGRGHLRYNLSIYIWSFNLCLFLCLSVLMNPLTDLSHILIVELCRTTGIFLARFKSSKLYRLTIVKKTLFQSKDGVHLWSSLYSVHSRLFQVPGRILTSKSKLLYSTNANITRQSRTVR